MQYNNTLRGCNATKKNKKHMKALNKFIKKGNNCCIGYKNGIKSWLTWSDATKIRKGGRKMTIEEKVDIGKPQSKDENGKKCC